MNDEQIISALVNIVNTDERDQKLADICGDDAQRDRIEARLREAGKSAASKQSDSDTDYSIMRTVCPDATHIVLREPSNVDLESRSRNPDVVEVPRMGPSNRYEVHGEIARGGMGAILKCRDTELQRNIAIKVLLEKHADRTDILQRFIEEAQIGSQLQHPGLAPVYEFGVHNARPFISMKLVKGKTLSKLIRSRQDVASDLSRFIGIFEHVCQTMAYVHSRGVIHRDLKSANIMVGAFGEVQIMDFGLAKVIGATSQPKKSKPSEPEASVIQTIRSNESDVTDANSNTRTGTVLGTPAYMPPEQALGEVDQLDERADVFSLGAILCEILTGKPPYVESETADAHRKAVRAQLKECHERLDNCGADPVLVQMARDCLEVEPSDRPRDASVLSKQVSEYVASVQTKLREAEIDRATQAARLAEEQKRRRLSYSIAALVIAFAITGLFVWQAVSKNQARLKADAVERERVQQSEGVINLLMGADIRQMPDIIRSVEPMGDLINPELQQRLSQAKDGSKEKLRLAIALLPKNLDQKDYLIQQFPKLSIEEFSVVLTALSNSSQIPTGPALKMLWDVATDPKQPDKNRFRTACALAAYEAKDPRWNDLSQIVAQSLTASDAIVPSAHLEMRLDQLRHVKDDLVSELIEVLRNPSSNMFGKQRSAICLSRLLSEEAEELVNVLLLCRSKSEFIPLLSALASQKQNARDQLEKRFASDGTSGRNDQERSHHKAIATVGLAHFGRIDPLIGVLKHDQTFSAANASSQSLAKHYVSEMTVDANSILLAMSDPSIESDLLHQLTQVLGYQGAAGLSDDQRSLAVDRLKRIAESHHEPAVRQSSIWAISRLGSSFQVEPIEIPGLSETAARRVRSLQSQISEVESQRKTAEEQHETAKNVWQKQLANQVANDFQVDSKELLLKIELDGANEFELTTNLDDEDLIEKQLKDANKVGGMRGRSIELSGDSPIDLGKAASFRADAPFSMGAWIYPLPARQWSSVVSKMDSKNGNRGVDLWIEGAKVGAHVSDQEPDNYIKVVTAENMVGNYWRHAFVTYDGSSKASGLKIYYDGQLQECDVISDSLSGSIETSAPLMLGSRSDGEVPFKGYVEDIQIFGRELSSAEVDSIYLSAIHKILNLPGELKRERQAPLDRAFRDGKRQEFDTKLGQLQKQLTHESWVKRRRWFVNTQGQQMTILPRGAGDSTVHPDYSFAIGIHEVTLDQFNRFRSSTSARNAGNADVAVSNVSWFDAAAYCNWLNEQEKIPKDQWCFEPNDDNDYDIGMKIKRNLQSLTGYRLPTAQEWSYACLGDAATTFSFGDSEFLLREHAWYSSNANGRVRPVGLLAPNSRGLFDMHGNVAEWTFDLQNISESGFVPKTATAELHGGAASSPVSQLSASAMIAKSPSHSATETGFRLTRTILLSIENADPK